MPLHHQQSTTHCELIGKSTHKEKEKSAETSARWKILAKFRELRGKIPGLWTLNILQQSHLKLNFLTRTHIHSFMYGLDARVSSVCCWLDKGKKKEWKLLYHAIDFSSRIKSHYVDVANDATFYIHTQFFSRSFHHSNTQLQLYFFLAATFPSRSILVAFYNRSERKRKEWK